MSDEEYKAIVTTSQYVYYKAYVENLEEDYDFLQKRYDDLKEKVKELKSCKQKAVQKSIPIEKHDFDRLRNQNIQLRKKYLQFEKLYKARTEEVQELKKEIARLKGRRK